MITPQELQSVRAQYERDWNKWPVQYGAPCIDRNHNGRYDPPPAFSATFTADDLIAGGYDEPGLAGAALNFPAGQVIWTVCNDLDENLTRLLQGSLPLGLEVQITLWSYNHPALANTFFRRVRLINKGGVAIDTLGTRGAFWINDMYLGQWTDPDLGWFGDDLLGCDPASNMGYVYNGGTMDREFAAFHLPPPALGYDLVQGPLAPLPGGTAIFDFKKRAGFSKRFGGGRMTEASPRPVTYISIGWKCGNRGKGAACAS
ncbi:MAG: hypothetical protein ONB48_02955 [candidate division KSB1 bacterium]|nr:hypothetical protein [candidate division KSB1 bacterium]MDZ7284605.1 hypothetical protein [candidate division KSB1 bacterium]MDZ7297976.1 hypothetical protein [candidate division KSB1 bacterium]MDZ7305856.1 hypothetical protein [candidate division KSB1 bacterium]MDZ7348841.1 hypothetical protein [candidate division KSB1 bacterium]